MNFEQRLDKAVENLPESFAKMVRSMAYDRGHSAGEDEVVSIASSLAYDVEQALNEYLDSKK